MTQYGASQSFHLQCDIRAPASLVHEYLCDLENYVELHPLIESIAEIKAVSELPNARRYRVVDRIQLGPLRFRIVYTAALQAVNSTRVRGYAWQFPGVHLATLYEVSTTDADPAMTCLRESTEVTAPWGLRRIVCSQAARAHAETLRRLQQTLGA